MMTSEAKITPMMAQWHACKKKAGTALLFFRMGDFYEAFYDDAIVLAKELELTLTTRQEIPMAGVPHHTCDTYIDRLVAKGFRIAVAEQTSDPKTSKGLVERDVTRIVTPGTLVNSSLLSENANNYFASVTQVGSVLGLAFLDLTTADFRVVEFESEQELQGELYRLQPSELLTSKKFSDKHALLIADLQHSLNLLINTEDDWRFEHQITTEFLISHLKVHTLDGFGLKGMAAGINASGALLHYLRDTLNLSIDHINTISTYSTNEYMTLDRMTQTNLELTRSLQDGTRKHTLLSILDQTCTPMGGRLILQWLKRPLLCMKTIQARQDAVQSFIERDWTHDQLKASLEDVRDIERLMMKVSANYASPKDIAALRHSIEPLGKIKSLLREPAAASSLIQTHEKQLNPLPELISLIANALVDEPPQKLSDGNIFRKGFHQELDEIREISANSKSWLNNYQNKLREELDIKNLKVGFNRMFGYYIEVSKGQAGKVPESFERRQTLVNAERFITKDLKEYEQKVLTAEEKISSIEQELFQQLRTEVTRYADIVIKTAQSLAIIDCLQALAEAARLHGYQRPEIDQSQRLEITEGRHPVIEAVNMNEKFVPNDTLLDDENNRLLLITGPNMAGKSTYIRQVALITIMAQIGSFVPAKTAHIGLVDKVFTRIGASDDLSRGQSTFMVEMTETANILNNATDRSLVILDEIGRGTSTYDGISIAWSVAEFLLTEEGSTARTLFATHYCELTKLEEKIPGAVNYNVAVHESEDSIIFLRKIVKGGTDKSYGIHVARLAGLPLPVIERAKEILIHLEENANRKSTFEPSKPKRKAKARPNANQYQLTFFGAS
ncbi:DNA mismatch repair protein mutS [Waddlia chondrophila 2032/99]|uniref:DNA mismatch repair protein MutS n=1 Tax=Waddlia chondrophila 2032/99 TaxID=765953 RepID=F8LFL3_9BACT|nr:DNA mismatch repair protein mutS [Waddlia chondrophila 2032/99]